MLQDNNWQSICCYFVQSIIFNTLFVKNWLNISISLQLLPKGCPFWKIRQEHLISSWLCELCHCQDIFPYISTIVLGTGKQKALIEIPECADVFTSRQLPQFWWKLVDSDIKKKMLMFIYTSIFLNANTFKRSQFLSQF